MQTASYIYCFPDESPKLNTNDFFLNKCVTSVVILKSRLKEPILIISPKAETMSLSSLQTTGDGHFSHLKGAT